MKRIYEVEVTYVVHVQADTRYGAECSAKDNIHKAGPPTTRIKSVMEWAVPHGGDKNTTDAKIIGEFRQARQDADDE